MQVATSSTLPSANDVIDLWWILYNKPGIVATFFFQRTTAFELVFIVRTFTTCSRQISCFRKTKAKTKCTLASRLIWQLVIHSCFIFAYKISMRTGENQEPAGFPGRRFLPSLLARPKLPLPFLSNACHSVKNGIDRNRLSCVFSRLPKMESFMLAG